MPNNDIENVRQHQMVVIRIFEHEQIEGKKTKRSEQFCSKILVIIKVKKWY